LYFILFQLTQASAFTVMFFSCKSFTVTKTGDFLPVVFLIKLSSALDFIQVSLYFTICNVITFDLVFWVHTDPAK